MRRYLTILILAALPFRAQAQGNITTIAGSTWVFPADGRPAAIAPLGRITALTTDQLNNLYVVDPENAMVFKVAPTGVLTIVAGNGISGFSGDFGPAVDASLNCPASVAVDNKGNVFIADPCAFRVRKVSPEGIITTVAGTGEYEVSVDGGPATDAPLLPLSVAVDSAGNLYIGESEYADEFRTETHRIRMVTPAGMISTVAGAGPGGFAGDNGPARAALLYQPRHLAIDGQGNIFFVEGGDAVRVRRFKPGGNISTVAGEGGPADSSAINAGGIALDAAGILYIADSRGNRVKRVQSDGTIVTVAGTGAYGHLGDGGPASQATFGNPDGIAVATSGDIYISDTQNKRIRRVNQATTIETIAGNRFYKFGGDGGAATAAFLNQPGDVVTDKTGNIFIADTYNHRIRKISNGVITTYAGTGEVGFSGDGGKATQAELCYPAGLAVDSKNNLYIADSANSRVRMVRPDGVIVSVAGGEYTCGGTPSPELPIQLGGRIYSVAIDSKDDLYVADGFQIHRIDANGATVLAGTGGFSGVPAPDGTPAKEAILEYPGGLAVDAAGIVYFGQIFTLSRIRTINANGVLGTLAGLGPPGVLGDGGPALQSDLGPASLRFDASGNLLIADRSDRRIRRISGGIINTVAGGGSGGANSGDGGPAVSASLAAPLGVAPGAGGAILIADAGSDRIRLVSPLPPTFDVSTERIDFNISSGGITPTDQTIKLTSPIAGLAYSAQVLEGNGNWLSVRPASGVMPATLLVTASPPTEAVGLLEARIAISIPAANQVRNVNVTLRITPADEPRLSTGTDFLGVPALEGGRQIVRQFQILNNGSGSLDFGVQSTTTTGGGWLEVTASGSTVSASSPQTATVRITPGTLTPGTYSGLITVSSPQAPQPLFVPVKLTVTSAAPAILLSQDGMNFESVEGAINLAPQTFGVVNRGAGGMAWTARAITLSGGNWLSLNQNSGTSGPAGLGVPSVQVKVDPSKLSLGDYYGQVEIVAPGAANSPQTLSVVLTVIARGGTLRPDIRPTGLIFVSVPAENGPLQTPPSQAITLTNYGETPITFRSSQSTNDFQFRPQSGTITGDQPVRIVVTPQPGLPVGIRRGTITLEFSDGTVRLVDILVIVPPSGALRSASLSGLPRADGCVPTSLGLVFSLLGQEFTTVKSLPTPVQVRVADSCGTFLETGTVVASFSNGDRLLALIPTGNGYWDGTWIPAAASAGAARVRIRVDAESLDRKLSSFIEITGGVNPGAATPLITPGGVVNSASPAVPSALAPGTLISIFGQRLAAASAVPEPGTIATQLEGTLVVLKGIALQLLYVSSDQINAMVPLDLPPNTSYQLFVQQGSKVAVPAEVLLAAVQPAIFSIAGTGSGQGAIISTGGALVDNVNPAQAGDTISIFAAGLGAVTPAVPSGSVSPSSPPARTQALVQVSIGGKPAVMTFAGLAPGFFGLYQINVVVPDGIPPGPSIPVTLTAGSETSPAVTIAVR